MIRAETIEHRDVEISRLRKALYAILDASNDPYEIARNALAAPVSQNVTSETRPLLECDVADRRED